MCGPRPRIAPGENLDRLPQPALDRAFVQQESVPVVDEGVGRFARKLVVPFPDRRVASRAQGGRLAQARPPIVAERRVLDAIAFAASEQRHGPSQGFAALPHARPDTPAWRRLRHRTYTTELTPLHLRHCIYATALTP